MNTTAERLRRKAQTGKKMYSLVDRAASDIENIFVETGNGVVSIADLPFKKYFRFVSHIPYQKDTKPIEVVGRPMRLIKLVQNGQGLDCKKKAIMIAAWIARNMGDNEKSPNGRNFRFVASSNRKDKKITHVFPEMFIGGLFYPVDATYKTGKPFVKKGLTKREIL